MGRVCLPPLRDRLQPRAAGRGVGIHGVERFLGDEAIRQGWALRAERAPTGKRVLVVGAGPVRALRRLPAGARGHSVTIREAGPMAGGMMRFGIPRYRLPRDVLDAEIERILDLGVHARMR
jgi:NADPH-dependent glutamate synthase beta subunit-like oxidoreductase